MRKIRLPYYYGRLGGPQKDAWQKSPKEKYIGRPATRRVLPYFKNRVLFPLYVLISVVGKSDNMSPFKRRKLPS